MPAIKLTAAYAAFALAASLAAQSNLLVEGLEAYNKGDYVAAERSFRKAVDQGGDAVRHRCWLWSRRPPAAARTPSRRSPSRSRATPSLRDWERSTRAARSPAR